MCWDQNYKYILVGQGLEGKVFQGNGSACAKFWSDWAYNQDSLIKESKGGMGSHKIGKVRGIWILMWLAMILDFFLVLYKIIKKV